MTDLRQAGVFASQRQRYLCQRTGRTSVPWVRGGTAQCTKHCCAATIPNGYCCRASYDSTNETLQSARLKPVTQSQTLHNSASTWQTYLYEKHSPADPVGWNRFGQFLFTCREADPGYYCLDYLRQLGTSQAQLKRMAVAWCSFYNLGIAAKASELKGHYFYEIYWPCTQPRSVAVSDDTSAARRGRPQSPSGTSGGQNQKHSRTTSWPHPWRQIRDNCDGVLQMGDYFKWNGAISPRCSTQQPVQFHGWKINRPRCRSKVPHSLPRRRQISTGPTEQVYRIANRMATAGITSPYAQWRMFDVQDAQTHMLCLQAIPIRRVRAGLAYGQGSGPLAGRRRKL